MRIARMAARRVAAIVAVALAAGLAVTPASAYAAGHDRIEGSGSSWAAGAVNQWVGDVQHQQGLQVVYTPTGSAQGRKDFALGTVDFAVSDIPYQGMENGQLDQSNVPYAYLPITAGGTAFPYQIKVGGKKVDNLRLSTETLAKIFTNKITNWNDPAIAADNNGRKLPNLQIKPVVHSEGSGATAMFTRFLAKQHPGIWKPFKGDNNQTEYWPTQAADHRPDNTVLANGSDGVMNTVASAAENGAIGYDEYYYALNKNWPVAKIENSAHYFTLPSQYNVAKSLTQAVINMDKNSKEYLIQNLDKVYIYGDPRTYPLSSYSYMVLPIGTNAQDPRLKDNTKRQTLADFLYYAICTGQSDMGTIGYSPLPVNLVQAGFDQIQKLKQADPSVDITRRDVSTCNNPTFDKNNLNINRLAQIAPMPASCDMRGAGPCSATGSRNTTTKGGNNGGAAGGPGGAASASAALKVDPDTGQVVVDDGGGGDAATNQLAASRSNDLTSVLWPIAGLELLAVLLIPAMVGRRGRRREGP